jgi:hypothetical protein
VFVRVVQVVEGQEAARLVGAWVSRAYVDRLSVEVSSRPRLASQTATLSVLSPD